MNIFTKTLLVSAMALAATGAAEARIATIGANDPTGSELVLNVVNYTAEKSFTLDLGVTIAQFMANPAQSLSYDLNANAHYQSFVSAFTAGDNVTWGVSGGHQILNDPSDTAIAGFYTTSVDAAPASIDPDWAQIGNTMGVWDNMVSEFNDAQGLLSVNNSTFRAVGEQGYTAAYGNNFLSALPFQAQGNLGAELFFVHEKVNDADFDTGELVVFEGKWNFDVTGAKAGQLTLTAVPVPAAVWMFGAGLMGVLRLNRRKSMAA